MQYSQGSAPKTVTLLWLFDKDDMKVVDTIDERRFMEESFNCCWEVAKLVEEVVCKMTMEVVAVLDGYPAWSQAGDQCPEKVVMYLFWFLWINPSRLILLFITNSFKPELVSDARRYDARCISGILSKDSIDAPQVRIDHQFKNQALLKYETKYFSFYIFRS